MNKANIKGVSTNKQDTKRLSVEFPTGPVVPLLTPSSAVQSIPPSPLKAEFTSTPPQVVKPLPVLHAARELQFDQDQAEGRPMKHLVKLNQSRADVLKQINKPDQLEAKPEEKPEAKSSQSSKTPSRSSSVTFLEDSIKLSSKDWEKAITDTTPNTDVTLQAELEKGRTVSNASSSTQVDTVSIDNLYHVIDCLESHDGKLLLCL